MASNGKMEIPPNIMEFILSQPALHPPEGKTSHLGAKWDEKYWSFIVMSLCMSVMAILILVRIYTKVRVVKCFEIADYFIIASYCISINVLVFSILALPHGWGVHQWNVTVKQLFKLLYYINILEILYGPLVLTIKIAVVLQYLRMFAPNRTVNPFVFFGSWIAIGACTVFYIITTFLTVYACTPREKIWNKLYPGGKCINYRAMIASTAFFNIISDIGILLLPVMTVWQLRIPTRKKIAIILLFCTGIVACVASAMRAYYTMRIITTGDKADISRYSVFTAMWSYAECTLGVLVATTLAFPKLLQAKGAKWRRTLSSVTGGLISAESKSRSDIQKDKGPPPMPTLNEVRLPSAELKRWHTNSHDTGAGIRNDSVV